MKNTLASEIFFRMYPNMFKEVLDRVGPPPLKAVHILDEINVMWFEVAISLCYLSTGDSYMTLQYCILVACNMISLIPETFEAIIAEYQEKVLSCSKTLKKWKEVASWFAKRWNLDHAVDALDGKHMAVRCPPPPPVLEPTTLIQGFPLSYVDSICRG